MTYRLFILSMFAFCLLAMNLSMAQVKFKYRPFDEEYFSCIKSKIHAAELEYFKKSDCRNECTDCKFIFRYSMLLDSSFLQSDTGLKSIKSHMNFKMRTWRVRRLKKDLDYFIYTLHIINAAGATVAKDGYRKKDFICGDGLNERTVPKSYMYLNDFILSHSIKNVFLFFEGGIFYYLEGENDKYYLLKIDRDSTLRESSVSELVYWSFFDEALHKKKQEENEP